MGPKRKNLAEFAFAHGTFPECRCLNSRPSQDYIPTPTKCQSPAVDAVASPVDTTSQPRYVGPDFRSCESGITTSERLRFSCLRPVRCWHRKRVAVWLAG